MRLLFTLCFFLISLCPIAQGFGKQTTSYKLPSTSSSGLIDIFFEYEPVFTIDEFQSASGVKLDLNIVLSRATALKGNFWYRYWYNGEQYTDEDLGRDVFVPIDLENIKVTIFVTGPGSFSKTMTYQSFLGNHKILTLPGKHKPSDFKVFIQGLEGISFKGTSEIHKAINDLIAAKRKKAAEAKTKEADALNTKNGSEAKEKNNQAMKDTERAQTKKTAADDDFWESGKKVGSSSNTGQTNKTDVSKLPDVFKTADGKFYKKDGSGTLQEIDYDGYMKLKFDKSQEDKVNTLAQTKEKQEADQKVVDDLMVKIKKDQAANNQIYKDIDRSAELQRQGMASVGAREEARRNLKEVSTLSGNYSSVEQLMADFNAKMAQLNSAVSDLTAKKNQALNSSVDAYFNTPDVAVYGEGMKVIGTMVNQAKQAKERKKAAEELKQQKETMLNNMLAEERRLLTGIRTDLFSRFKEGALPLSSSKLSESTIYYFVYAYDPAQLGARQPALFVSNIFPVNRYSDGTWPFKTSITNDIAKLTPYAEILHGYYTSQNEAEAMQGGLMDVFAKSGGAINRIAYKGKKPATTTTTTGSADFWETGKKKKTDSTSKEKKQVMKNDFWNN